MNFECHPFVTVNDGGLINSYSSRMHQMWADIYNQLGLAMASLLIISSYLASARRITVLVNFQAILLIFLGETSSNCGIFFTDDTMKKFFLTSKISAQEICHQFFLISSNLTIMAHIVGLGNQSENWKIIILS